MPWTYILCCTDGSYYVGSARDVDERMSHHAIGTAGSYTAKAATGRARLGPRVRADR